MTTTPWQVSGQYYETCSCDFICPCLPGRMAVRPTQGSCAMGIDPNGTEPLHFDHTGHPAADRFALARASTSHVHALGLSWDDESGTNNGQYAPFGWRS